MNKLSVSFLIATLNSERTLPRCLEAIRRQAYPETEIEIIVADGGSADRTCELAATFGALVVKNPLVTGESGKAAALRYAKGDLVALVDSDNILVGNDWLQRMTRPFEEIDIFGAEPRRFVAERSDTLIDRYCAVIGANDPFCIFAGVYDKESAITGRWSGMHLIGESREDYFVFDLVQPIPTIGANGTIYRRSMIVDIIGDHFMDIDVPLLLAHRYPKARFAKVDVGIRHLFCVDQGAFVRKQTRRVRDYFSPQYRLGARLYPWGKRARLGVFRFVVSCLTIVPLIAQSVRAFIRSRDPAAFYHPVACWLTLVIYGYNVAFARGRIMSRAAWRQ